MSPRDRRRSPFRVVPALLLAAAGVYLAARVWAAAGDVLTPLPASGATAVAARAPLVEKAREMDRGLAAVDPGGRDPLHRPFVAASAAERRAAPVVEAPPELRMLLYDQVSPVVQLAVSGALSPRLRVGDTYSGWRVESITSSAVVVSKDGRTHSLSSRRAQ